MEKSFWQCNWKWIVPILGIIVITIWAAFSSGVGKNLSDITRAYGDAKICTGAIKIANNDKKVKEFLGEIGPIGNLAILEGAVRYSNDYNTLGLKLDINSSKMVEGMRVKMDVFAERTDKGWDYQYIALRIKEPPFMKQTIPVLSKEELP